MPKLLLFHLNDLFFLWLPTLVSFCFSVAIKFHKYLCFLNISDGVPFPILVFLDIHPEKQMLSLDSVYTPKHVRSLPWGVRGAHEGADLSQWPQNVGYAHPESYKSRPSRMQKEKGRTSTFIFNLLFLFEFTIYKFIHTHTAWKYVLTIFFNHKSLEATGLLSS